jgi:hypothetical protein
MTKNYDDYKENEDMPLKPIARCRIIDHEIPGFLVMLMEYFDSPKDDAAGKTSAINMAIDVDAAEMLGAALINSARARRQVPEKPQ